MKNQSLVKAKFPKLNKRPTLEEYEDQLQTGDYSIDNIRITETVVLSPMEFSRFTDNLLHDHQWLDGKGGNGSTYETKYGTMSELLADEEEVEKWRKGTYRICLEVTDGLTTIYVDPQGYSYARYVGFPIQ